MSYLLPYDIFFVFSLIIRNLAVLITDVSTTMIIQPGSVAEFLVANQKARDPFSLDWAKVRINRHSLIW